MVQIAAQENDVLHFSTPALVVPISLGEAPFDAEVNRIDEVLKGALSRLRSSGEFKGAIAETQVIPTFNQLPAERIVLVGLGEPEKRTVAGLRRAAAAAARTVRKAKLTSYTTLPYGVETLGAVGAAQAIAEGSTVGLYRFDGYRKSELTEVERLTILTSDTVPMLEGVRRGEEIAAGVMLARDLINEPPNVLTPTTLAGRAQEMASASGLSCQVLDVPEMQKLGMNALLGVASGSDELPAFIVIHYGASNKPHLALVGKGITFDSGGISIKPAENMHHMKGDMGGAAAVLGAMRAIARLKPAISVTAIIPTTENLLGGKAQVPGDIVRAMNGVSIEIINTDAEGRLILADALSYAVSEGLTPIIDVATLTGAAAVALGPFYAPVFSNDDDVAARVLRAAQNTGERFWRMPLDPLFDELIKSDVAEIKNSAVRAGGSITAAMFLQHFVDDTPWAHLDIAATSWSDKDEDEQTKGGAGVAVRTLISFVEELAAR